jgi:hypothetical protein
MARIILLEPDEYPGEPEPGKILRRFVRRELGSARRVNVKALERKAREELLRDPEFVSVAAGEWIRLTLPAIVNSVTHSARSIRFAPSLKTEEEQRAWIEAKLGKFWITSAKGERTLLLDAVRSEARFDLSQQAAQIRGDLKKYRFKLEVARLLPDDRTPVRKAISMEKLVELYKRYLLLEEEE